MAEIFEWNDEYNVGVADIDEQHLELVGLINELHAAIRDRKASKVVRKILDELIDYTSTHFSIEERLMRESGYPDYEAHRSYHEALIDQVRTLQGKLDSGEASVTFELLHFLRVWLIRHICEADKEFGAYFIANGTRPEWMVEAHRAMTTRRWWQFWKARA